MNDVRTDLSHEVPTERAEVGIKAFGFQVIIKALVGRRSSGGEVQRIVISGMTGGAVGSATGWSLWLAGAPPWAVLLISLMASFTPEMISWMMKPVIRRSQQTEVHDVSLTDQEPTDRAIMAIMVGNRFINLWAEADSASGSATDMGMTALLLCIGAMIRGAAPPTALGAVTGASSWIVIPALLLGLAASLCIPLNQLRRSRRGELHPPSRSSGT